jgi:hypothetical protein
LREISCSKDATNVPNASGRNRSILFDIKYVQNFIPCDEFILTRSAQYIALILTNIALVMSGILNGVNWVDSGFWFVTAHSSIVQELTNEIMVVGLWHWYPSA